jgi:hypothetical protein
MAEIELQNAEVELQEGNYDAYIKSVEAANIDAKEKQQLINLGLQARNIEGQISSRKASDTRAETSAKNRLTNTDINTYNSVIQREFLDGDNKPDKQAIISYIDGLISNDVDESITDELYKTWNIQDSDFGQQTNVSTFGKPFGYSGF